MNWKEATKIFISNYSYKNRAGRTVNKQSKLPYDNFNHEDIILVNIPVCEIKSHPSDLTLVENHKEYFRSNNVDPVWLSFGRFYKDGSFVPFWDRKFQVLDGNHRVAAAKELNIETISSYMPKTHYEYWGKE